MSHKTERSINGNDLISRGKPRLHVQVNSDLTFLGHLHTTVSSQAKIDNYFFAEREASSNQANKVLYFQFEEALPESSKIFDYPDMQSLEIAGYQLLYDGGVRMYRQSKIDSQPVNSDIWQTVNFLKQHNIKLGEGEYYGMLRFVLQFDESKQQDLLIIYLERLQETDVPEDVIARSWQSDEWDRYCEQLLAKALRTFTICEE